MINILSVDPGETSGWALLQKNGNCKQMGQLAFEPMMEFINNLVPEGIAVIVIEDFVVFRRKAQAQTGSRHKTVQIIGALKSYALRHNIPVVMQGADIKKIAEKWSQIKPPADHAQSHQIDAFNHGFYYLVKNHYAKTALERKQARDATGETE